MSTNLNCYRCGASLADVSLPLRRLEECPTCSAELHVCRMCVHFAPRLPTSCDEDDAPEVREKARANFCDYFKPSADAYSPGAMQVEAATRASLAALFGDAPTPDPQQSRSGDGDEDANAEAIGRADSLFKE